MATAKRITFVFNFGDSIIGFRGSLVTDLLRLGHQVTIVCPPLRKPVRDDLLSLGARVTEIPVPRTSINPIRDLMFLRNLRVVLRRAPADVLLLYTIKPIIWGTIAGASLGIRNIVAIVTGLGYTFADGRGIRKRLAAIGAQGLYRLALRHATTILFLNPDDRRLFHERGLLRGAHEGSVLNGEGVDLAAYPSVPLPPRPSFLMIARLLREKGVREYAEAARKVMDRHSDVTFRLVGYLDQSPDSISQAELDGMVASGVEFLGRLDDVRPAIAESSIYVLPSYREGIPRSVLEAMAMGRPVITTDAPGCRETVIAGVNGFLVKPGDAESLATAMEKMIREPRLTAEMGLQSRRIVEEKFDVNLVNMDIIRYAKL